MLSGWRSCILVLVLSGCCISTGQPAVSQVRSEKQWLALIDAPTGGNPSPDTGTLTRSSSTSVVTCTKQQWILDAFATVAEERNDQFQFLLSSDWRLCRKILLDEDRIGLVTSIHQSVADGVRDLRWLDLRALAAERNYESLPPRETTHRLQRFLSSAAPPLVGFLTMDNMMSTYDSTRPLMILFCPFSSTSEEVDPRDVDDRVARQHLFARSPQAAWCRAPMLAAMSLLSTINSPSNLTAVVAEVEEHRQMELQEYGFGELDDVGVGARTSAGFKYRIDPADQVPTADILVEFAKNVIKAEQQGGSGTGDVTYFSEGVDSPRTLRPHLKSAPVPRTSKKQVVKTVVGETFHDIVLNQKKDVLIAFYAPWCEACPGVLSELKTTAASLRKSKVKRVEVARFDITTNDAPPNFRLVDIPTVYWAPVESKEVPTIYEGDLTARGFTSFLCQMRRAAGRPFPDDFACPSTDPREDKEL